MKICAITFLVGYVLGTVLFIELNRGAHTSHEAPHVTQH
jgi:hypothetical protein